MECSIHWTLFVHLLCRNLIESSIGAVISAGKGKGGVTLLSSKILLGIKRVVQKEEVAYISIQFSLVEISDTILSRLVPPRTMFELREDRQRLYIRMASRTGAERYTKEK